MGGIASAINNAANAELSAEQKKVKQLMALLQNKKKQMIADIDAARGDAKSDNSTQVAGGRTIMRVSDVRVSDGSDLDSEISSAISSFFSAAQGSIDGEKTNAKHSAVKGAESLLQGGIKALLGVSHGQSMEKSSFTILFINNAFVRCDYKVYTYSLSAEKWGVEKKSSGAVYVTDLAVLEIGDLKPAEIDFLISQAMQFTPADISSLEEIKVRLVESSILSRMLQKENITFDDLSKATEALATAEKAISAAFKKLTDYEGPGTPSHHIEGHLSDGQEAGKL